MDRNDPRVLARIRLAEAHQLLDAGMYDGAYYLCGYAVECGLKACIAAKTARYSFPDRQTVLDSYTHDLNRLVAAAALEAELAKALRTDPQFALNWAVVKDWKETSRYGRHSESRARNLYAAVTDRRSGVLPWIRHYW